MEIQIDFQEDLDLVEKIKIDSVSVPPAQAIPDTDTDFNVPSVPILSFDFVQNDHAYNYPISKLQLLFAEKDKLVKLNHEQRKKIQQLERKLKNSENKIKCM